MPRRTLCERGFEKNILSRKCKKSQKLLPSWAKCAHVAIFRLQPKLNQTFSISGNDASVLPHRIIKGEGDLGSLWGRACSLIFLKMLKPVTGRRCGPLSGPCQHCLERRMYDPGLYVGFCFSSAKCDTDRTRITQGAPPLVPVDWARTLEGEGQRFTFKGAVGIRRGARAFWQGRA